MYRGIPHSELTVIPGASHGLLVEKPALCNTILIDFLDDLTPTLAPIRRKAMPHRSWHEPAHSADADSTRVGDLHPSSGP